MDVILIRPQVKVTRSSKRDVPVPLGLLSVATPLDIAGYKVTIIDQREDSDWERTLLAGLRTRPICVGISSMTGPQIWGGIKASEIVKRNSDVPVVWGGVHPSLLPEQTLENPYVDIVVQGEGEETFLELARTLGKKGSLSEVAGIWYKDGDHIRQNPPRPFIDLNQQPPLSYHLMDLGTHMMKLSGVDALLFETSRGCPYECAFCYNTCFSNRQWRALSADETLLRMKRVIEELGIRNFAFSDDNFFTDPDRAYQILEGIVRLDLGIAWGKGDMRLDFLSQLDDDYLRLIERSGCRSLIIGVESGSQRVADVLRKGIDVSQAISLNRRLTRYKIQPRYLFLIGIPGETEADLAETASLMLRLADENPNAGIGVQILVPYPGTDLFDLCIQHGLQAPRKLEDWVRYTWLNRNPEHPWLSPEMKKLLRMISFCSYFIAKYNAPILSDVSWMTTLVSRLYLPVARRRMGGLHYRFAPEIAIADALGFKGY